MSAPIIYANTEYVAGKHVFKTVPGGSSMGLATLASSATCNVLSLVDGNVGVGTTAPREALHVVGNILSTGTLTASNVSVIGDFVTLNTVTSNTEQMVIENAGTGPALKVTQTGANSIAEFYDDGGVLALKVADGGSVGIGTTTPAAALHVQGNVYVSGNFSAGNMGMFRNVLINGDMRINQRGTSTNLSSMTTVASVAPGSWVADRWNVYRGAYAAGASIAQGTNISTSDLPFQDSGIQTFARIQRVSGNAATSVIALEYNMESQESRRYAGKTVTLSFYYRTGSNFSGAYFLAAVASGTGTDEATRNVVTGYATVNSRQLSASSTWVRVSMSATFGTNINQLFVDFNYTPIGTAGANDYFDITGIQLELGNVATPYEVRPYAVELQLCQRYYIKLAIPNNGSVAMGYAWNADWFEGGTLFFPQVMRTQPIGSFSSLSHFKIVFNVGSEGIGLTDMYFTPNLTYTRVTVQRTHNLAYGRAADIRSCSDLAALYFSAEL